MNRDDWRREILKRLVDRRETMTSVCNAIGCSRAWIYKVINGEAPAEAQKDWQNKINAYLKIEEEPEEEKR